MSRNTLPVSRLFAFTLMLFASMASHADNNTRNVASTETASSSAMPLTPLSRDNTVLLLVDHQIGLFTGVRDIPVAELTHNVVGLAKAAKTLGIPVVLTATMPDGMWGPTIPELKAALPGVDVIARTSINAWDDPKVRAAIEKTGRKQVLIAGVSLEICAMQPALSAKMAGYDSRVVLDASGTFGDAKRTVALARLAGTGVPITDYASAAIEMLGDNTDPKAVQVYSDVDMPFAKLVWQLKNIH
ncbi:TPA: isochorismatase family protein [Pseudomonas aeruginosa]|uniref:isochorismatase family protein n=1 Tax=Pseudomonas aeruginosa TaxID=287 RepID=UPI0019129F05|nr:isochorismatase family protein [Pseudomonas aeruginosa]MEB4807911.1 isochorismatase family protein [Pseudomonas aeruginosa]MEB4812946.1 isochorismatase family protein [Pseudomonas aeruginosa]MEB4877714.1 isochorismatase family protein [Pseudomonas aeruginosa]MEB4900007.1 isochorismatase family protein [Pseudomonas aeruginosa]MEB4917245.1 isochorismatase family protein [Pseudomonas aeruginosa]